MKGYRLDAVLIASDNDVYPSKCMLKYVRRNLRY